MHIRFDWNEMFTNLTIGEIYICSKILTVSHLTIYIYDLSLTKSASEMNNLVTSLKNTCTIHDLKYNIEEYECGRFSKERARIIFPKKQTKNSLLQNIWFSGINEMNVTNMSQTEILKTIQFNPANTLEPKSELVAFLNNYRHGDKFTYLAEQICFDILSKTNKFIYSLYSATKTMNEKINNAYMNDLNKHISKYGYEAKIVVKSKYCEFDGGEWIDDDHISIVKYSVRNKY